MVGEFDLATEIRRLESEITAATTWYGKAVAFNRAGDRCVAADDKERAKRYHGFAIDAYLYAASYDVAAAVCRKMLRYAPEVVRARCTLAFLAVGQQRIGDAAREIEEYVRASRAAGLEKFAIPRLALMSQATDDARIRAVVARVLDELGAADRAEEVLRHAPALELETAGVDTARRWRRLLRVVVMDPQELWVRYWTTGQLWQIPD